MKILTIAWKDTLIRFRDRNALILMIVSPLVLSAIIGSAFGDFISGSDPAPFDAIPVLVVNADNGELGQQFVDILSDDDLADLLDPTEMDDLAVAREMVQRGEARTAVFIPNNFSQVVQGGGLAQATIQFYADPGATITPNIVRGIIVQIANGFSSAAISSEVAVAQVMAETGGTGLETAAIAGAISAEIEKSVNDGRAVISLHTIEVGANDAAADISPFAFFAPSMGILFLMFAMMDGTRSILDEERQGTLRRLISTPTRNSEILLGKIGGVFLTGLLQFVVFVIASRFIFQLNWGSSLTGLVLMTLAVVLAFTSLGTLIAAFARDENQANIIGTVVTLVFAALGGNFAPAQNFPTWLEQLSKITITRWGLDGFSDLTMHNLGLGDVMPEVSVLIGLSAVLFALALTRFQRRIAR